MSNVISARETVDAWFFPDGEPELTLEQINHIVAMMIVFTRCHVEDALKAAHKELQLPEEDLQLTLDCYPLTNIK